MKHIGIMGGTFNPIHNGHLFSAEAVRESLKLDMVLFIPTGNPPHKQNRDLIDCHHRFNMVKLAIEDNPNFILNDIEIKRKGTTYTVDTLCELHNLYYGNKFYFIIGFDTLKEIGTWKDIQRICQLCSFVVVNRNSTEEEVEAEVKLKSEQFKAEIHVVNMPNIDISSTYIREKLHFKETIKYLTPDKVIEYIIHNNLYN